MSGSQILLTICGLTLFSFLALNVNKVILNSSSQTDASEYIATATNIGQNVLNMINTKSFDQNTIGNPTYNASLFTPANLLGPDSGESAVSYNDIDDYNNFADADTTPRDGVFNILVHVNYVDDDNPNTVINTVSRTKRIQVAVKSLFMKDTLFMYAYKSY